MTHVMLDLETFGLRHGSVIRSIGAVVFDPRGRIDDSAPSFYRNISRESCEALGMTVDPGTERWWATQSQEARDALDTYPQPFVQVARAFNSWWSAVGGEQVWCQGANFDAPLWESCVAKAGIRAPWKYYNVRDTRTVYDLFGLDQFSLPKRIGTYHNALDDAVYQAGCVQLATRGGA